MQLMAKVPERFAAWELTLTLSGPRLWVMPQRNGRGAITQVNNTAWVQDLRRGERQIQMLQQSRMTASRFQSGDLSRPNIEHPRTSSECSGTAPCLVMGFQERHGDAITGQQCRCG